MRRAAAVSVIHGWDTDQISGDNIICQCRTRLLPVVHQILTVYLFSVEIAVEQEENKGTQ